MKKIQEKMMNLTAEIRKANREYFGENIPFAPMTYTDTEYDQMYKELKTLEEKYPEYKTTNSPTERVGGYVYTDFETVTHKYKMLSLEKAFNADDLHDFDRQVKEIVSNPRYTTEEKLDGLAIRLNYEKGYFVKGVTRGNGSKGDDVTEAVKTIKSVPLKLTEPIDISVRGEIVMPKDVFVALNEERVEIGEEPLANVRNAAVGSLKQFDTADTAKRKLDCYVFEIFEGLEVSDQLEMQQKLSDLGFKTTEVKSFDSIEEIIESEVDAIRNKIPNLNYAIDGMVVKVRDLEDRKTLGERTKTPKWAIAYKFPAEQKETILKSIEIQVGRTGALTPRATFDTIELAGTQVTHATLHNQDFIDEKDIRIGDTIIVEKSGEIIPKVLSSVKEKRPADAVVYQIPDTCPICNGPVNKDEVVYKCENPFCDAKIKRALAHYVSDKGLDIKGFGQKTIDDLVDFKIINKITDLYKLEEHKTTIINIEGLGEKSYKKIIKNIEKSKNEKMLSNFLSGLGIPLFGRRASKTIADQFLTMDRLLSTTEEEITAIEGIGSVMAKKLVTFLQNNQELIEELNSLGVCMKEEVEEVKNILEGLKFVVTGTLEQFTRKSIKESIKSNGGKVSSSVSGATDYLICGKNAGSKLTKAKDKGVPVISEDEYKEMVNI